MRRDGQTRDMPGQQLKTDIYRSPGMRMITIAFGLVLILGCVPKRSVSQGKPMEPASIESLKTRIGEVARTTRTISCDFTQEKVMSMIAEKVTSRGKFCMKKEKMLRWEYLQPFSYLIIIKNDQFYIKDDTKVNRFNVQSNKVFMEINRVILGSIQGTLLTDERNFKAAFTETPSAWIVRLKTLSPALKASLSEIIIYFDRKDYTVTRLDMNEPGGDTTTITFTARKLNQPIADEMFTID
jgi:outer membrane lipoprotein-sorting protein